MNDDNTNVTGPLSQMPGAPQNQTPGIDAYQPPQDQGLAGDIPAQAESSGGQSLEDQNIFFMLGVTDGSEEERESFLDELQEVIWEDFLEKDVELLITKEEMAGFKEMQAKGEVGEKMQEKIVAYLEKLIPDLEEIMLEKALELKEDMFRERISDMKDFYKEKQEILENIRKAEALMAQDKWKEAAEVLNAVR